MYRYSFEQLSEAEFEALVVDICQNVLGIAAHSFATGRDGGRDSQFSGTAAKYPNAEHPWTGNFIIQAKHTNSVKASCSDNDFSVNKSSVLHQELAKMKVRVKTEKIDCYIVFTNRKLTGEAYARIKQMMSDELGIGCVDIHGVEDLMKFVERNTALIYRHGLARYLLPDVFYEKDIRDVIVLFSQNHNWAEMAMDSDDGMEYIDKEEKNRLNGVDEDYFKSIRDHSLKFFSDIDAFLKDPRNAQYLQMYLNTVSDLRGVLLRNEGQKSFVEMLENIIQIIAGADHTMDIHKARALVRVFVHYMYWNCDIGKKE